MSEYELAERLRGGPSLRAVELGVVVGVEPLVVRIGNGEYKAGPDGWRFYEPVFAYKDVEFKDAAFAGAGVNCSKGGISVMNATTGTVREGKAKLQYQVGDLLAVQQMAGDVSFLILARVQEVV